MVVSLPSLTTTRGLLSDFSPGANRTHPSAPVCAAVHVPEMALLQPRAGEGSRMSGTEAPVPMIQRGLSGRGFIAITEGVASENTRNNTTLEEA